MESLKFITDTMEAIKVQDYRLYDEVEGLDYLIRDLENKISELINEKESKLDQIDKNNSIYRGLEELLNKIKEEF